jgi:hypothetical protein
MGRMRNGVRVGASAPGGDQSEDPSGGLDAAMILAGRTVAGEPDARGKSYLRKAMQQLRAKGYPAASDAVGMARSLYKLGLHNGDNRERARAALAEARELVAKGPTEPIKPDAPGTAGPGPRLPWLARTREDKMLRGWRQSGTVYAEVPVGGADERWGRGTTRRLDGVRVDRGDEILRFRRGDAVAREALETLPTELIEVKQVLNTTAIGQVVAGRVLFKERYGRDPSRSILVCAAADIALRDVCTALGIDVEMVELKNPRKAVTKGMADHKDIIAAYQEKHGGQVLTGFAVGLERGVGALHLADAKPAGVNRGTASSLEALPSAEKVQVIHVATKVTRGSIGRVLTWGVLFEKKTGRKEVERVILHRDPIDAALNWCCQELGIRVVRC